MMIKLALTLLSATSAVLHGLAAPPGPSQTSQPAAYETFCKLDVYARKQAFNQATPENRAELVRTQVERYREAYRTSLTTQQLEFLSELIAFITPDAYGAGARSAESRARAKTLQARQAALFTRDDMQLLQPMGPCIPKKVAGAVAFHSYQSRAIGGTQEFHVYTPPGYDAKRKEPYPVFYLLHGLDGNAYSWVSEGGANATLDKLIAEGKAKAMILVMPLSFGSPDRRTMVENFSRSLLGEIIPRIEEAYNASTDRTARAIAGLSMGGAESLLIGLNSLDQFAWVGSFSPAAAMLRTGSVWNFPTLDATANARLKLVYIVCGTADRLIDPVRQFRDFLTTRGVKATFVEVPDAGHVWPLWRGNLADMAQMVFQASSKDQ